MQEGLPQCREFYALKEHTCDGHLLGVVYPSDFCWIQQLLNASVIIISVIKITAKIFCIIVFLHIHPTGDLIHTSNWW